MELVSILFFGLAGILLAAPRIDLARIKASPLYQQYIAARLASLLEKPVVERHDKDSETTLEKSDTETDGKIDVETVDSANSSVLSRLFNKRNSHSNSKLHYKSPLSKAEQKFYLQLSQALPDKIILSQVSFASFLAAKGGTEKENFSLFSTVRQKYADFVICDRQFAIEYVVELDDKSHNRKRYKDERRDASLKQAGLTTLRFPVCTVNRKDVIVHIQHTFNEVQEDPQSVVCRPLAN